MNKASSAEEYKQLASFEALCETLKAERFADRLEKPLAYWALPGDRRLPLAFLGRTLSDLLSKSYAELAATPGIGHKKMGSLMRLLARAVKDLPTSDFTGDDFGGKKTPPDRTAKPAEFNPANISESMWEQWRGTIRRHHLEQEKLGRLAPSLQLLPTVVWEIPLAYYLDFSLAQLREQKTYGDKRVRAILEVCHMVHSLLGQARPDGALNVRLVPKFVLGIENWLKDRSYSWSDLTADDVRLALVAPLVQQLKVDCGDVLSRLAETRLGLHNTAQTVRVQSKRLGVTRARVYQLFEECEQAMQVRWPEGRYHLLFVEQQLEANPPAPEGLAIIQSTIKLFFPDAEELAQRKRERLIDS